MKQTYIPGLEPISQYPILDDYEYTCLDCGCRVSRTECETCGAGETYQQQRRKNKRDFNKQIQKEGRSLLARKLLDADRKAEFQEYTASSHNTAVMPFCIAFEKHHDLNDYAFCCREGAEAILDNDQPKFIVLIKEPGAELPAPKAEIMKIGTRIFNKKAPNRVYIFLEIEGTAEEADIIGAINFFMARLGAVPEDEMPPNWLLEYVYL